jgi:hypothetical protein
LLTTGARRSIIDGEARSPHDRRAKLENDLGAAETEETGVSRIREHATLGVLPPASVVKFTFDGAEIQARAGEPIAAALLAAGIRILRTMPRFGDPRGSYCMVGRCADCLVVVDGVLGVRACVTAVAAGLDVRTQVGLGDDMSEWPPP